MFILAAPGLSCSMWDLLVAACGLLVAVCEIFSCGRHEGCSSQTRDRTQAPCIGSAEYYPLDYQGSPIIYTFNQNHANMTTIYWAHTVCLVWFDVVYISAFITPSKNLCKGADVTPTAQVKNSNFPRVAQHYVAGLRLEPTPRPLSCSADIYLSHPKLVRTEEGGLWLMYKALGLPSPRRAWFYLLRDGLWDVFSASAQWLSQVMPISRSSFISLAVCFELRPSGSLKLYPCCFCKIWQRNLRSLGNKTSKQQ